LSTKYPLKTAFSYLSG